MKSEILKRQWKKALNFSSFDSLIESQDNCFQEITVEITIGECCDEGNINEWLNCDSNDPGFKY